MNKILLTLGVAIILMTSCQPAKYIVLDTGPTDVLNNCIAIIKPLNKKAVKQSNPVMTDMLIECDEYVIGDTVIVDRKHFTNF